VNYRPSQRGTIRKPVSKNPRIRSGGISRGSPSGPAELALPLEREQLFYVGRFNAASTK